VDLPPAPPATIDFHGRADIVRCNICGNRTVAMEAKMIALKTVDMRNGFKKVSELVNSGEKVLIARPHNENIVVLSEKEYNELEKAYRNAEYMDKIDRSLRQLTEGRVVVKTMEELEDMAK
jgi:antitoxin YefM